ncbi:methylamine utilization protein [Dyadobacter beijingensis]|uniref:Methylamine utilization protein n=1 Tax=Dyadobacter beijingensis TaxID=365489 RepID=A0ABQ2HKT0_9BACT|nr:cytochrome c peroxidase [Dyadobacter beijingensis]GGM83427.1 methylamine utilization protein [Dyadobacter beijingensis]
MSERRGKRTGHQWPSGWAVTILTAAFCVFAGLIARKTPAPYELKYPANFGSRFTIPADNPTTQEGVYLGRMLFYEKKLSANNLLSCESCHEQRLAFTDGRPVSPGVDGSFTPRSSMSLANLLWVRNFFWDGRSQSLETQAAFPLTDPHEMGQSLAESVRKLQQTAPYPALFQGAFGPQGISEQNILKALAQFERTLISADSPYDRYLAGKYRPTAAEMRGMLLFENNPDPQKGIRGANCGHCHGGPKTFKELFHNNGLDSTFEDAGREKITGQIMDKGRFRVPTLRNILLTAPYMHDGRFKTIEAVLDHYSDHIRQSPTLSSFLQDISNEPDGKSLGLAPQDKKDIIAFLGMLTDSTFMTNPAFSNPISKAQ